MTSLPALQAEALVVHLFIAANGARLEDDRAYLRELWAERVGVHLGMTERLPIEGLTITPDLSAYPVSEGSGLLAARMRPRPGGQMTPYVEEALLRRRHDTFCLTVMREPSPEQGKSWADLDREWSRAIEKLTPSGMIGEARLYLARLVEPGTPEPDSALASAVRARYQLPQAVSGWENGVAVPPGFAVWETSAQDDARCLRQIIVVAAAGQDAALSGWTWVAGDHRELPRFGRYLLHAAKLRYQLRIWRDAGQRSHQARQDIDTKIDELLAVVAPHPPSGLGQQAQEPSQRELIRVSRELAALQARHLGLVRDSTLRHEMRRTVEIAAANMTALSGDDTRRLHDKLGGMFAEDRDLGVWFAQQLADDTTYLDAARERAARTAALTDQLVQRGLQDRKERLQQRQERFNLALTGLIGAILMVLAAIQSLQYSVPLPPLVKPAVITALGAVALLASLMVLRVAVPDPSWSLRLVWAGVGATAAAATWVVVSAIAGNAAGIGWWAGGGFVVGVVLAALVTRLLRWQSHTSGGPGQAPV
ncbi:MAG: CATRA conflict system CASPASE/TPR repeat-associated protein [Pseudonocardiaceae bacterium]